MEVLYTKYINLLLKDNDSREITKLITEIKQKVKEKYKIDLHTEQEFVE